MGVMDKFLNYMKLNEDEDDYYDDDYLEDETVEEKPKKQAAAINDNDLAEDKPAKKTLPKVTPMCIRDSDETDYEENRQWNGSLCN